MSSKMDVDVEAEGPTKASQGNDPSSSSSKNRSSTSSGVPLHRVRFVDWQPSSVSALAFLPVPSRSTSTRSLLAVGRENGNIDLCTWVEDDGIRAEAQRSDEQDEERDDEQQEKTDTTVVSKGWIVDTTLVGSNPSKVDSLVFVLSPTSPYPTPRLFSTSGGAIVTEHFLPPHLLVVGRDERFTAQELPASVRNASSTLQGSMSRSIASQGGAVWSMAASPLGKHLAIGCEDGTVRIIDIEDGRFELQTFSRSAKRAGDGTVRGVVSTLDRAKTRIVSLAWGPPKRREGLSEKKTTEDSDDSDDDDDDDDEWEDSFIIGGTTQSSALVWSTSTGRITNKLLTDRNRREQTIVWSVAALADGTCVLGDSLGHVSFFDAKSYTLLNGAKFSNHGKNADVLALCVGPDGKSVYSASVDQRVVEYALVEGGTGPSASPTWVVTGRRRLHAHDIRAIATDPPYDIRRQVSSAASPSSQLPLLVTGGVDFHLVITPASSPSSFTILAKNGAKEGKRNGNQAARRQGILQTRKITAHDHVNPISSTSVTTFADTIHRRLPFVPATGKGSALGGGSVVRVCSERRWLVVRREKSVAIWKLPADASLPSNEDDLVSLMGKDNSEEGWYKVLEIQAKVRSNLVCVEISNNGRFLLMSDLYETKLFELQRDEGADEGEQDDILPKRIRSFSSAFASTSQNADGCPGCSAATFTQDNARVVLATHPGSFLHVVELADSAPRGQVACTLLKSFDQHRQISTGRAVAGKVAKISNGVNGKANGHLTNGRKSDADDDQSESDSEDEASEVDNGMQTQRSTFARIDMVQCSPDGQYLVSIDTAKRIHTFSLDTLHHRGIMPSPSQRPNAVVFDPWQPHRMLCVLPTNQVTLLDVETRREIVSSGEADVEQTGFVAALNQRLAIVRDNVIGAFWLNENVIVVWGASFMCTARLIRRQGRVNDTDMADDSSMNVVEQGAVDGKRKGSGAKRPLEASTQHHHGDVTATKVKKWSYWRAWLLTKYQPLLFVGTVQSAKEGVNGELVVVERPYYDIARSLPPTWFGGAGYGT